MSNTPLTIRDLLLMADDGLGYGYVGHTCRQARAYAYRSEPYRQAALRDEAVLAEANRRGWTHDQLVDFVNSRDGRQMGDALQVIETVALLQEVVSRAMVAWTLWAQVNGTPNTLAAPPPDLLPTDTDVLVDRSRGGVR